MRSVNYDMWSLKIIKKNSSDSGVALGKNSANCDTSMKFCETILQNICYKTRCRPQSVRLFLVTEKLFKKNSNLMNNGP